MNARRFPLMAAVLTAASCAVAQQTTNDPFPDPIPADKDVIVVGVEEFASVPDVDGAPARMMLMVDERATGRLFVNDMRGPLYTVSADGRSVELYLDVSAEKWGVGVQSTGNERGVQSFAFHPQFAQEGASGYGKLYTWTDSENMTPPPDFTPGDAEGSHHTVLHEWTARNPHAGSYDGGAPRELMRFRQPYRNHNGGHLIFNPLAEPGDADYGMVYMGVADGGSGGDPLNLSQNMKSGFGKIFRIDPLGSNSANGKYGIPADNPFVDDESALDEIYASGARNPQRFGWDSKTGAMYMAEIGQNIVEEISPVTSGADLGWNDWEGSFIFISRQAVRLDNQRGDPKVTYPIVEWGQPDPLFQPQSAATGLIVYRDDAIPELANLIVFGDIPSGEVFYVSADDPPSGGQDAIRRILFDDGSGPKKLLELIQAKNVEQGREPARRADLRFGTGPDGQVFLINKRDGVIRRLLPRN